MVVTFSIWIYAAYRNLYALRVRGLQYSPGWAVGYFFIPIMNLFRPLQVFQEMWKASDARVRRDDPGAWRHAPLSVLAGFWWACWIISNLLANASMRANLEPNPTVDSIRIATMIDMISSAISILAGILVIILILALTSRQKRKYAMLHEEPAFE